MRPIIIGAGRGSRLGPETAELPKTLVQVMGRPMLDWILEAFAAAGIRRSDVVFVCGYARDVIRARYPEFTFVENRDWAYNNILASLLCAREYLEDGFLSSYSDIVYDAAIVQKLVASSRDIVLGCDTNWRRRYVGRTLHPESDAEKMRAEGERVTALSRTIPSRDAQGEFIGVMKLSPAGAKELISAFDRARDQFAGRTWREGRSFEKAYLIDQLADMLEHGTPMHRENTPGAYMEIDTEQDLAMAERWWTERG
jgi:choline kinase